MLLTIITITVASVGLLYLVIIIAYIIGISKTGKINIEHIDGNEGTNPKMSVIIPFKNESGNLDDLFKSLDGQTIKKDLIEFVFVDDHSTDDSLNKLLKLTENKSGCIIHKQDKAQNGKKAALLKGISLASGEIIVTTDADCVHESTWLESINKFCSKHHPKMLIAPVEITGSDFFENLQSLEFSSLTAATAGSAGIGRPIMCNAANLAFEKVVFKQADDIYKNELNSGDDIFLLHHIKKQYPGSIAYLNSKDALVYTKAEKDVSQFFRQRLRWASKAKYYKDTDSVITALSVFMINVFILVLFISAVFDTSYLKLSLIVFTAKLLIDSLLLAKQLSLYGSLKKLCYLFPLALLYPIYISYTGFRSLFIKNVNWK
jgi:glycosyltransferase involved in cell wall biosynthesis